MMGGHQHFNAEKNADVEINVFFEQIPVFLPCDIFESYK